MMSNKGIPSEENKLLGIYEKKISELKEENKQLNQSVKKMLMTRNIQMKMCQILKILLLLAAL